MADQTLNIPSLLLVLIIAFLTVRYFFFSPSSRPSPNRRGADPAHVEQISSMFPQVGRREIMWDLQRNGGSVAATTERILGGRGLEVPPPSFQPLLPPPSTTSHQATNTFQKPTHPNLITRYNLTSRLASSDPAKAEPVAAEVGKWAQNRNERQALLQRRREEMVLNARRKLEEEERARAGAA
ncbi:hypothetical protein MMC29_004588 [Sticta canariensis]|nr:hypothetical protein [Sticta canariensis]